MKLFLAIYTEKQFWTIYEKKGEVVQKIIGVGYMDLYSGVLRASWSFITISSVIFPGCAVLNTTINVGVDRLSIHNLNKLHRDYLSHVISSENKYSWSKLSQEMINVNTV